MIIDTIIINGAAGFIVGIAWVVKELRSSSNGNGKLSKADHRDLCDPIKRRLDDGDHRFSEILKKIDANHDDMIEHILELTVEVNRK